MQWFFMLVGSVLGLILDQSPAAALLGALLGLIVWQTIALKGLTQQYERLQNEFSDFAQRLGPGAVTTHPSPRHTESEIALAKARSTHAVRATAPAGGDESSIKATQKPAIKPSVAILERNIQSPVLAAPAMADADAMPATVVASPLTPSPRQVAEQSETPGPSLLDQGFEIAKSWLLGGNTVLRTGVVLLFIGLAFLLRYASEQVVVAIELRYAGVALAGIVLLGIGWRARLRKAAYGLILQGAGIAVLYLTAFAAMRLHPLISPAAAFALLIAVTLCLAALAIVQNAMSLAVVAVLGGFAAPILTSSGSGNHVALFSYFALLNACIFAIAWFQAWRQLNLVGFIGTFGIGLAWGLRSYTPELFISTEPFLLLFFLMYVGIGLLFARRKLRDAAKAPQERGVQLRWSVQQADYVDASVLFGPPLAGFGLQCAVVGHLEFGMAFSALALGLFYLALGWVLRRRATADRTCLLVEICLALGVVFSTLSIPLALDARWTSAAWAVEGAAFYWLALKQGRRLARMFALLLQGGAAAAFLVDIQLAQERLLDGSPLGALMLGAALMFSLAQLRRADTKQLWAWETSLQPMFGCAALFFLYLIAPLCFGVNATAIIWAFAGLATLHAGLRLGERSFLGCAFVIQLLGGTLFATSPIGLMSSDALRPLAHSGFWTPAMLALAGLAGAWCLHRGSKKQQQMTNGSIGLQSMSRVLLVWGAGWWALTAWCEANQFLPYGLREHALIGLASLSVLWCAWLARREQWCDMTLFCLLLTPVAALAPLNLWRSDYQPLANLGWLAWLMWLGTHLLTLRGLAHLAPVRALGASHILGCWLLLAVLALEARYLVMLLGEQHTVWQWLGWAVVPCAFLLLMSWGRRIPWPLDAFSREYRVVAALPVALALLAWFWLANLLSSGAANPLPYVPLFNPLELGLLTALFVLYRWSDRMLPSSFNHAEALRLLRLAVLGASLFAMLTLMVCRVAHHFFGVFFEVHALYRSLLVQAGLSLLWTLCALVLTILGSRLRRRDLWMAGAGLVAVVVVKLFFIELGNSGSLERIISFIGVGVLLLLVGYFSPLPPRHKEVELDPESVLGEAA
ncbi:DUF2339 domain-containing protein [Achromobacter seleniivolatilans]|uniref:DUF2339 domain-containing protein n=1 Tax=Achromobacter seleniivolatilans TaxID=3047478 RepID=A0ABY9LVY6_9BURK|nr:DUF2339 domain-containing protein [Achromobacter sp. R39]WMD18640.1 DUF2339 domain-containing protein [Achromobacter sp. R39]